MPSYLAGMRRFLGAMVLSAGLAGSAWAADPTVTADIEQLKADVERLMATNLEQQKRITELTRQLQTVREEANRQKSDPAVGTLSEQVRKLSDKIEEVDRKRIGDAGVVKDQFEKLATLIKSTPAPSSSPVRHTEGGSARNEPSDGDGPKPRPRPPANIPDKGYEYVVQSNDTVSGIIGLYNTEFKKQGKKGVSLQQVLDANPGLRPEKLKVGQKIFIPMPQ